MADRLLVGIGRILIPIPPWVWRRLIEAEARKVPSRLRFMTEDHHRVRDFAVRELSRVGEPLTPGSIGEALDLAEPRVRTVLEELESHLTFLFRNDQGAVTWAYPVTVEETPHRAHFSTGEDAYSP